MQHSIMKRKFKQWSSIPPLSTKEKQPLISNHWTQCCQYMPCSEQVGRHSLFFLQNRSFKKRNQVTEHTCNFNNCFFPCKTKENIRASSQLTMSIHLHYIVLSMFMLSFIFVMVCGLIEWNQIWSDFASFVYIWIVIEDPVIKMTRGDGLDPIKRFNPMRFLNVL